jgi:vacuolar protein sorting-associated protein 35
VRIAAAAAAAAAPIETVAHVDALFKYLAPLIIEEIKVSDDNRFEFEQEQHSIAQLFQLIKNDDCDIHYELYGVARRYFGRGGKDRIEHTMPPLVFNSLQLAERSLTAHETNRECRQIFGFIMETINLSLRSNYPEMAMRLYLMAATSAARCKCEAIAYEFVVQAFVTYEEHITDSKAQFACITYLAATLQQMPALLDESFIESYDTLVAKCAQHSSKLMIKQQACRGVYTCSHLFWTPGYQDAKKVLACLKRSLKFANSCVGEQFPLFVEILNKYLYFFEQGCPSITSKYLGNMIALIDDQISGSETSPEATVHYENTLNHIKAKQSLGGEEGRRYLEISASAEAGETE